MTAYPEADLDAAGGPSAFSDFFAQMAKPVSFGVDRTATMADSRTLSLVETGSLDLFAVDLGEILHGEALLPRAGGELNLDDSPGASARWTYLCRVEAGTMMIGAPAGPRHSLLGRPLPGTRVSRLPMATLQRIPYDVLNRPGESAPGGVSAPTQTEIVDALESGLIALSDGIRTNLAPREFVAVDSGATVSVPDGSACRLIQGAGWIYVLSGNIRPFGDEREPVLVAGSTVFVTGADWMVAEGDTVIRSRDTSDLLADGSLWASLERQHARCLYSVDQLVLRRQQRATDLLERRRARDNHVVRQAIKGFSSVVERKQLGASLASAAVDPPPLAVMRLVAGRMGLTIVAPQARSDVGRSVHGIEAVALASRLRTRPIRLVGQWWRHDTGPLIGYRKDDSPVALMPSGRGYQMVDPASGTTTRMTPAVAKDLSPQATILYRPLPEGTRTPRDLLRFGLSESKRDIATFAWSGLVVALLGLLVPILTGTVLGTYVPRNQRAMLVEVCLLVIASGLVSGVFAAVQNLTILRLEGRVDATIQAGIWDRLLALPLRFFAKYSTGDLSTAALAVNAVRDTISGVATTATIALLAGILNLVLVFFYSVTLGLVAVGLVLLALGVGAVAGVKQVRLQREIFALERSLSARVFQLLTGLSKLRVAAAEDRGFVSWAADFTRSRNLKMRARVIQNFVTTFNAGFILVATLVIFALAGEVVHLPTSAFLSYFAASTLLLAATLQFTGTAVTVMSVVPMMENLEPILTSEREISPDKSSPGELSGEIEFNHVVFSYTDDGPTVLDDLSFKVRAGEFLAVVGPTGCGKSTLVRLLLGFDVPTSGSVLFDGQDLEQLDILAVRRQIGVVLQNGALIAGDIKTNIIGNSTYSVDDAWEAARMSGFDEDIKSFPMGMFTVLSEGGSTLSGGQRQRLMIARALVSRPRILIMDEATSALDNPTQARVAESTHQLHATRIVIAHRLSTIRSADRIIVLDSGRILQEGSFDELIADDEGMFAQLAKRQLA